MFNVRACQIVVLALLLAPALAAQQAPSAPLPAPAAFASACTGDEKDHDWDVTRKDDKFDNFTKTTGAFAPLKAEGRGYTQFWLQPRQFVKAGKSEYDLVVLYRGSDWMFIDEGESIVFLADGARIALRTTAADLQRDVSGSTVVEAARYPIEPAVLLTLASAKELQAKLTGSKVTVILAGSTDKTSCALGRFVHETAMK